MRAVVSAGDYVRSARKSCETASERAAAVRRVGAMRSFAGLRTTVAIVVSMLALDVLGIKAKAKGKGRGKSHRPPSAVCSEHVAWAMTTGIRDFPERYPGLNVNSSLAAFRQRLHDTTPASKCPDSRAPGHHDPLPSFTSQLGLNNSQLAAYRSMRKSHADALKSPAFKALSTDAKQRKRQELAASDARAVASFLSPQQLAIFANHSAAIRRPPAMHVAAGMVRRRGSAKMPG